MDDNVKNLVTQALQGQQSYAQLHGILGKQATNDVMNQSMALHGRDDQDMPYQQRLDNFITKQGGGGGPEIKQMTGENRNAITKNLDMRDYVHYLVAKGATSPSQDQDIKSTFGAIVEQKGLPFAQKLFSQIAAFNERSDIKGRTNPEDRINQYYNIGSGDADIQNLINSFKGLGGKPVTTGSTYRGNINMGMGVQGVAKR